MFEYRFLLENHTCFRCHKCKFIASSEQSLKKHNQMLHSIVKVDIPREVLLECDFCDYTCKFNIQMKKHVGKHHASSEQKNLKYNCDVCDFSSDFYLYLCEHKVVNHDNVVEDNDTKTNNIALGFLVEQNIELINEIQCLKRDIKEAFGLVADKLDEQTNTSNEMKQELFILRNCQTKENKDEKAEKKHTNKDNHRGGVKASERDVDKVDAREIDKKKKSYSSAVKSKAEKGHRNNHSGEVRSRDKDIRKRTNTYQGQNRFTENHRSDNLLYRHRNLPHYKSSQSFERLYDEGLNRPYSYPHTRDRRYNYPRSYNYSQFTPRDRQYNYPRNYTNYRSFYDRHRDASFTRNGRFKTHERDFYLPTYNRFSVLGN